LLNRGPGAWLAPDHVEKIGAAWPVLLAWELLGLRCAHSISARLGVPLRTVQRDLARLRAAGYLEPACGNRAKSGAPYLAPAPLLTPLFPPDPLSPRGKNQDPPPPPHEWGGLELASAAPKVARERSEGTELVEDLAAGMFEDGESVNAVMESTGLRRRRAVELALLVERKRRERAS